jgi:hypothetical protein
MHKILTTALAAVLSVGLGGPARADSQQVLVESGKQVAHAGPVRGAIGLARPAGRAAGRAARAAGRAAVVAGRVVKPGRRAAWLARAVGRGVGKAAKGVGRAAKFGKLFRPFKKRIIVP